MRRTLALTCPTLLMARSAFGGSGGQPSAGRVRVHWCLCPRVPGAARQSWHLRSVTCQRGTEARRVWHHWPPEIAEARSPLKLGRHCGTLATLVVRPWSKPFSGPAKSISMVPFVALEVPTSQPSGRSPGRALMTRANRHLRTDLLQAWTMAAGESSRNDQVAPRSSTTSRADDNVQPKRIMEAISADTGPVTRRQGELLIS